MELKKFWWVAWLFFYGCSGDPKTKKWTYMPDMVDSPVANKAQRGFYLEPPVGSVSKETMIYPKSAEDAEQTLRNPYGNGGGEDFTRAEGKKLYDIFCAVCHGLDAKGGGTIIDRFPRPPDLTADLYKNKKDGFFFYRITFGSLSQMMGGYGHAIDINERWKIVSYLRSLQESAL